MYQGLAAGSATPIAIPLSTVIAASQFVSGHTECPRLGPAIAVRENRASGDSCFSSDSDTKSVTGEESTVADESVDEGSVESSAEEGSKDRSEADTLVYFPMTFNSDRSLQKPIQLPVGVGDEVIFYLDGREIARGILS